MDVAAILYGMQSPIFAVLGVDAVFSNGTAIGIRVLDDTGRSNEAANDALVQTVAPGAYARKVELDAAGITVDNYDGATLTFNGQTWRVSSHEMRGSPQGENAGAVRFILSAT